MLKSILMSAVALLGTYSASKAAEIYHLNDPTMNAIYIGGEIVPGDSAKFLNVLRASPRNHKLILSLNSGGGELGESIDMARVINKMRGNGVFVAAAVSAGDQCSSACLSLFAAADRLFVQIGGT